MDVRIVVEVNGNETEVTARGRYSPSIHGVMLNDPDSCYPDESSFAEVEGFVDNDGELICFASKNEEDSALEVARAAIIIQCESTQYEPDDDHCDSCRDMERMWD